MTAKSRPLYFVLVLLLAPLAAAPAQSDQLVPTANLPPANTSPAERRGSDWIGRAKFIRSHWVRLQPNGDLIGRITLLQAESDQVGAQSLDVSVYQKGQLKGEARTDENGDFVVSGLSPGVYALVARGSNGFVAYGLTLVPSLRAAAATGIPGADNVRLVQAINVSESLRVTTAAVPPTFNQLRQILEQNFSKIRSNFVPPGEYAALLTAAQNAADALAAEDGAATEPLYGVEDLQTKSTDASDTKAATTVSVHPVILEREQGRRGLVMRGRLYGIDPDSGRSVNVDAESTTVFLIQNDKRIATTKVQDQGKFDFFGIDEGVYSLVAIGESGFGAVSFRAVRPSGEQATRADFVHLVQLDNSDLAPIEAGDQRPPGNAAAGNVNGAIPFAMALIDDPQTISQAFGVEQVQGADVSGQIVGATPLPPSGLPASPASPATATSGGFASGGGPLLPLLTTAAIATAIPLSLNNQNDQPQLMSPFIP